MATKHRPTYIIGDLNARLNTQGHNTTNRVGKGLERFINKGSLTHLGPEFGTYHDHRSSTTPDIVLGNNKIIHNISIDPGPLTESDHLPIIITLTSKAITTPIPPRPDINKANWESFSNIVEEHMNNMEITDNMTSDEIDRALNSWYNTIESAMNQTMPTIAQTTTQKPITSPLLKYIQHQHTLLQQMSQIHGWTYQNYCRHRMLKTMLGNESKRIRNQNWTNIMEKTALRYKDPKSFWKNIKNLKGNKTAYTDYLQVNNIKLTNDKDKENAHRSLWQEVFKISPQENLEFDRDKEAEVEGYLTHNETNTVAFERSDLNRLQGANYIDTLITKEEMKAVIKSFKNNTPGESNINKIIIKNIPERAITLLQKIFNHSLSLGYFPKKFKTALIKLIPKANSDSKDPKNYRPISLLEVPGKILEKIVNKRLRDFLERNNIITDKQHGFRTSRGTDTALTVIHESIAHHIARKSQVYLILRDVSKAFDKVWHKGLQYKISQLQLPLCFTKFLNNFITEREAKIKIGNFTGPSFPLSAGVPQGSSISPTLYSIYTNDIPEPAVDCTTVQYADDITQIIVYHGKSRQLMANRVINEIEKINYYEKQWKIKTNKNKFKIIPIGVKKKNDIYIDGNQIQYSNYGKVLGVKIGTTGYNKHIQETTNKGKHAMNELQRFYTLPPRIKLHLVKAFIRPIITYAPIPLITASNTNIKKLQGIQNRSLRFAHNERYPYTRNTKTLHEISDLEPINYTMYMQANKVYNKLTDLGDNYIVTILDDYDENKNHYWFSKIKNKLERGIPERIYTV